MALPYRGKSGFQGVNDNGLVLCTISPIIDAMQKIGR